DEGVSATLRDTRTVTNPSCDFVCQIETSTDMVATTITEGYLTRWESETADLRVDGANDRSQIHKAVFETNCQTTPRLGFHPDEYPVETLQRIFVFIDNYDIRPGFGRTGHKRVATDKELRGQHIFVYLDKTNASATAGDHYVVDYELPRFLVPTTTADELVLIEVPQEDGEVADLVDLINDPTG
ncbi:MAG: hypothetical protein ABEI52_08750, partial [Halobacteriaceae archaeon]